MEHMAYNITLTAGENGCENQISTAISQTAPKDCSFTDDHCDSVINLTTNPKSKSERNWGNFLMAKSAFLQFFSIKVHAPQIF